MKKGVLYFTVLLLVSLVIMAGCTESTPTATAPAQTTQTAATPEKPIEIIAHHGLPAVSGGGQVFKTFGDRIEKASNGRVKFTYYWSSSLVPPPEIFKAIDSGAVHVGWTGSPIATYFPMSWYPFNLPFMGIPSMEAGEKIFWDLWNSTPEMRDEWKGFKLLAAEFMPPAQIHTTKSQLLVPADNKGRKIAITSAGPMANMVAAAGGAPVILAPPDIAISLSSGVVEGMFDHFPMLLVSGAMPELHYHTIVGQQDDQGMSYATYGIIMKESFFDSLPSDIQQMFIDSAEIYGTESMKQDRDVEVAKAIAEAKKLDHTIVYLTPDQIKQWKDIAKPIHQEWIKEYEAKGKPAQMIYDKVIELIQKYSK